MSSTKVYLTGFLAFKRVIGVSILVTTNNANKKKIRLRRLNEFEKAEIIHRKLTNRV